MTQGGSSEAMRPLTFETSPRKTTSHSVSSASVSPSTPAATRLDAMTDLRRVVHKASRPPAAAREPRPLASSSSSSSSSRPSLNNLRSFKRKTTSGTDSPKPRKAPLPRVTASSTSREYGSTTWTRPAWDTPTRGGPARRAVEDPPDLTSGPKEEAGRDDDGEAPWSIWLRNAIFARQRSLNSKGKQKQVIDDEDEVLVGEQSYESPSDRSLDDEDPPIAAAVPRARTYAPSEQLPQSITSK